MTWMTIAFWILLFCNIYNLYISARRRVLIEYLRALNANQQELINKLTALKN